MMLKVYRSPQIHDLGSVTELTEGSTPGDPDSSYHNHQRRTKKAKKTTTKKRTPKKPSSPKKK